MGSGASSAVHRRRGGRQGNARSGGAPSANVGAGAESPCFDCQPRHNLDDCPARLLLRVGPEALTLLDARSKTQLRCFPYHRIMCWGHNSEIFKFRTFVAPAGADAGRADRADDAGGARAANVGAAASKGVAASATSNGAVGNAACSSAAAETAGATATAAPDAAGSTHAGVRVPTGAAAAEAGSQADATTTRGGAGAIHKSGGTGSVAPSPDELVNVIVSTRHGAGIEAVIMATVKRLMMMMEASGIVASEFAQLCQSLQADGEQALAAVRQAALSRRFDIKQAVTVVRMIGELSPFDKVEAAIIMYRALMNQSSFPFVLDTFPDPADRENLCHRLDIRLDDSGKVVAGGGGKKPA